MGLWCSLAKYSMTGLSRHYRETTAAYPALPPRGNIGKRQPLRQPTRWRWKKTQSSFLNSPRWIVWLKRPASVWKCPDFLSRLWSGSLRDCGALRAVWSRSSRRSRGPSSTLSADFQTRPEEQLSPVMHQVILDGTFSNCWFNNMTRRSPRLTLKLCVVALLLDSGSRCPLVRLVDAFSLPLAFQTHLIIVAFRSISGSCSPAVRGRDGSEHITAHTAEVYKVSECGHLDSGDMQIVWKDTWNMLFICRRRPLRPCCREPPVFMAAFRISSPNW